MSFPDVNADEVEPAVRRSYEQFNANPIREFVPVIDERMAREGLRPRSRSKFVTPG